MISLHELVYEKLHLNKYTNVNKSLKIAPVDDTVYRDISIAMQEKTPSLTFAHETKMTG